MGLWLGMSFVSLLEFFVFAVIMLAFFIVRPKAPVLTNYDYFENLEKQASRDLMAQDGLTDASLACRTEADCREVQGKSQEENGHHLRARQRDAAATRHTGLACSTPGIQSLNVG